MSVHWFVASTQRSGVVLEAAVIAWKSPDLSASIRCQGWWGGAAVRRAYSARGASASSSGSSLVCYHATIVALR